MIDQLASLGVTKGVGPEDVEAVGHSDCVTLRTGVKFAPIHTGKCENHCATMQLALPVDRIAVEWV
ncbi:hypothetical protein, partial [Nocardia tengchongensis]